MSFAEKLNTVISTYNINSNGIPHVLTAIIAQYDGRKYAKVQQEGSTTDQLLIKMTLQTAKGVYQALYEDNNIKAAIEAIKKYGWSNKILKPITDLIVKKGWDTVKDTVEFIFAQYEGLEDGLSTGANLLLGLPFQVRFWNDVCPDPRHPKMYEKQPDIYFRLLDLWLRYRPLINYGAEINHEVNHVGAASVFNLAVEFAPVVNPTISMRKVMKIYFENGLDVDSCWHETVSYSGKVTCFQTKAISNNSIKVQRGQVFNHLVFEPKPPTTSPTIVSDWLKAGLSPNTLLFQFQGRRCYSWLMAIIQKESAGNTSLYNPGEGLALLLEAGADANQPSLVYYERNEYRKSRWTGLIGYVMFSEEAILPLKYVMDQKNYRSMYAWETYCKPLADLLISYGAHV